MGNPQVLVQILFQAMDIALAGEPLAAAELRDLVSQMSKIILELYDAGETDPENLKKAAVKTGRIIRGQAE